MDLSITEIDNSITCLTWSNTSSSPDNMSFRSCSLRPCRDMPRIPQKCATNAVPWVDSSSLNKTFSTPCKEKSQVSLRLYNIWYSVTWDHIFSHIYSWFTNFAEWFSATIQFIHLPVQLWAAFPDLHMTSTWLIYQEVTWVSEQTVPLRIYLWSSPLGMQTASQSVS